MKKNISLFIIALLVIACSQDPHYTVKGKIDGSDSIIFYLLKRDADGTSTLDSALSVKGNFTMKGGSVEYPQVVQLVAGTSRKRTVFYLENSEIEITGTLDSLYNARITGSKTQDEYNSLIESSRNLSDQYSKTYQEYMAAMQANNTGRQGILKSRTDSLRAELFKLQKDFVRNNPSSYINPSLLSSLSLQIVPEELESLIDGLDTAIAALPQVKSLKERLVVMKVVAVGRKAPDFTMSDTSGNQVSLSSKLGSRLLLIDFWAAWCNPCRQENPNLVKVYNEFHKKGFDILGVSLDQERAAWLKAIADDRLTWTHVSDLKYWGNEAAKMYAVNSIPSNFLLDETGTIIARNLRGDDLYNKVKEVLEKK